MDECMDGWIGWFMWGWPTCDAGWNNCPDGESIPVPVVHNRKKLCKIYKTGKESSTKKKAPIG